MSFLLCFSIERKLCFKPCCHNKVTRIGSKQWSGGGGGGRGESQAASRQQNNPVGVTRNIVVTCPRQQSKYPHLTSPHLTWGPTCDDGASVFPPADPPLISVLLATNTSRDVTINTTVEPHFLPTLHQFMPFMKSLRCNNSRHMDIVFTAVPWY